MWSLSKNGINLVFKNCINILKPINKIDFQRKELAVKYSKLNVKVSEVNQIINETFITSLKKNILNIR